MQRSPYVLSRLFGRGLLGGLFMFLCVCGAALAAPFAGDRGDGSSTSFTVASQTLVPGQILAPGTYKIRVVDRLSDRMILEVTLPGGKRSTFLALPRTNLPIPSSNGPVILRNAAASSSAIRGYKFADGTFAEFVYPKAEAVSLAKANSTTIPAVDPASEGRAPLPSLSHGDLQEVTLWMLSPTAVGPDSNGPGISAARYQAPAETTIASAQAPAKPRSRAKPAVAVLPHTASSAPLLALCVLLSCAAATLLTRRRMLKVAS